MLLCESIHIAKITCTPPVKAPDEKGMSPALNALSHIAKVNKIFAVKALSILDNDTRVMIKR